MYNEEESKKEQLKFFKNRFRRPPEEERLARSLKK